MAPARSISSAARPPRDRTSAYAADVIEGRIIAGEFVVAACARHLDDLITGPARGLEWRSETAERMIDTFPAQFSITDGPRAGEPFELLTWMVFVAGSMFGWFKGGRLRFDTGFIEIGKGQGKSPFGAATGLICTAGLGRKRAQVFAVAPKEDQARVLFRDAAAALTAQKPGGAEGESLMTTGRWKIRGVDDNAHAIVHAPTGSTFRTTSGSATRISGPRPDFVFVDEVHELPDRALIDMWMASLAKNAAGGQLWMFTNTPAMTQHAGTYYSEMAQAVVSGRDVNDALFVYIARVDVADRADIFDHEEHWIKAMPALGVTFPIENIRREVAKARVNPSEAARVNRLYLGIPTGAVDFWLSDSTMWDACVGKVDPAAMVGLPCWLALDLSNIHDLTALGAAWLDGDGKLHTFEWYWTVAANLERRARADAMPYDVWAQAGHIEIVPGASIDKEFVAATLAGIVADHQVQFLSYDVAMMASFIEACGKVGLPVWRYGGPDEPRGKGLKLVSHAQGTRVSFTEKQLCMPVSINALEERIREGTIVIDDNPVTYACAANAAPITDAVGNRAFDKKRSRGRIDGLIVKAMAVGAAAMSARAVPPPTILFL